MFISAILVALLATCGQWWFFGPITKCLVYPLTTGTLVGVFMGDPMTGMLAGANIQLIYLGWISAGGKQTGPFGDHGKGRAGCGSQRKGALHSAAGYQRDAGNSVCYYLKRSRSL